ncbi:hypothetical protein [Thioalkalivibrio sp.]|uniref:hypothetical protein n=1 Tax=Thioalkalivibrio sp. TaxID=2093813 RepID=UPI003976E981
MLIFRSAAIKEVKGFDESLPVSEDRELIFRMLNKQYGCGSVQIPLVNFYVHPNPRLSTSDNLLRQVKCDATIVKRYMGFIEQHPTLASRYLNLLARREREAGLFDQARLTLKLLLKIRPYDVRALRRLALWPLTGR